MWDDFYCTLPKVWILPSQVLEVHFFISLNFGVFPGRSCQRALKSPVVAMRWVNSPLLHTKLDSLLGKRFYSLVSWPGNVFKIKNEVQTAAKGSVLKQNVTVISVGMLCELPSAKSCCARAPGGQKSRGNCELPSSGEFQVTEISLLYMVSKTRTQQLMRFINTLESSSKRKTGSLGHPSSSGLDN